MSEPRTNPTPDETLVTPRFDEEETVLAQPVVPLDAPGNEGFAAGPSAPEGGPAGASRRRPSARQWPLALALASALVGSVIGGLGLYLFQQRERADAEPARQEQQAPAQTEVSQPTPAPAVEQAAEAAPAAEVIAPVETAPEPEPDEAEAAPEEESTAPTRERADAGRDEDVRREERAAAAPPAPREAPAPAAPPRRGKKGERDAEVQRRQRSLPPDSGAPVVTEGGARRIDTIVYPTRRAQRRAERRARRAGRDVDRLRAIFEGQPE